jgi:hypothetical protein
LNGSHHYISVLIALKLFFGGDQLSKIYVIICMLF